MCDLNLNIDQLLAATGGRLLAGANLSAAGLRTERVVIDSRQARGGDLFWALAGESRSGAEFADEAWLRGATGVVTDRQPSAIPQGKFAVLVDNGQTALWQLAQAVRGEFTGTVVGVTGSVGKTTTREMIHTVLASKFSGVASQHNFNNHIGVPLSLLQLGERHRYGVFELAASTEGEIGALARLCHPQIAVVTRIAEAHLSGFGSIEQTARAKTEILDALPEDGLAIVNGDCAYLRKAAAGCGRRMVWFGRSADCDLVASGVTAGRGWLRFRVERQSFAVPVWGRHFLTSALAAIAVGRELGLTLPEIAEALCEFEPPDQRCEVEFLDQRTVINDTYNACPTTMRAALAVLRDFNSNGRRVVICGDMLELGDQAERYHRELGRQLVELCGADLAIACGEHAATTVQAARRAGMPASQAVACRTVEEIYEWLARYLAPDDVVLVKGSRGMRMERVVEWLREAEQPGEPWGASLPRLAAMAA